MTKKIKTIICLMFAFCFLCGCSSSINYSVYSDEEYTYREIAFTFSSSAVLEAERTASIDKTNKDYQKWTVEKYLKDYMSKYTSYEYESTSKDEKNTKFFFVNTVEKQSGLELTREKRTMDEGFFFISIEDTYLNPFQEYYDALKVAEKNDKDYNSLFGVLLHGNRTYIDAPIDGDYIKDENGKFYRENFPSMYGAFPALNGQDFSNIATKFLLMAPNRTDSSGTTVRDDNDNLFYLFSSALSDDGARVVIRYSRMNSVGWFTLAGLIGGLTVGILFLVVFLINKNKKKQKPQSVKDLFPYDPFS